MNIDRSELEDVIKNCIWPSSYYKIVKDGTWDKDVVYYFERLEAAPNISHFIEDKYEDRFGYMVPALSEEGLLYFLPKFLMASIQSLDSELTNGLLSVLCHHSQKEDAFFFNKILSKEQKLCLEKYLRYFVEHNPDSHMNTNALNCLEA